MAPLTYYMYFYLIKGIKNESFMRFWYLYRACWLKYKCSFLVGIEVKILAWAFIFEPILCVLAVKLGFFAVSPVFPAEISHQNKHLMNWLKYYKYGKCSKILNTFLFLSSNEMLVFRAGYHKMLGRITSRVCTVFPGLFGMQLVFEILEHLPYSLEMNVLLSKKFCGISSES